jgi:predicted MPP superfamily phosphohydrolase
VSAGGRRKFLRRILVRRPFTDATGRKPWLEFLARAQPHAARQLTLTIPGWPRWEKPLRIAFLADFHTGSHSGDPARLQAIVREAQSHSPDLVLLGGDFVNMMLFGGGRVPPQATCATLARLRAPLGTFAVLGNHDHDYGASEVSDALSAVGIPELSLRPHTLSIEGRALDLIGIPDARQEAPPLAAALGSLSPARPTLVLAHDPHWFKYLPRGPHLMLSGHTHGGQIRFPLVGALRNASFAPLRWSYGHIVEDDRQLYVTSGLGTSGVPLRIGIAPEYVMLDVNGA